MKNSILTALFVVFTTTVFAQVEITPTFGYTVSGKVQTDKGYLNVQGATSYGGLVGVHFVEHSLIEFSYRRSNPTIIYEENNGVKEDAGSSNIDNFHLGFSQEFEINNDQILPFANFNLGSTRYRAQTEGYNYDSWLFSMSFGGGVKIFFNDFIGLRLQTNLLLPSAFGGNNIYCGWYGCYPVSSYYIPLVHWDNSLGLIFKID